MFRINPKLLFSILLLLVSTAAGAQKKASSVTLDDLYQMLQKQQKLIDNIVTDINARIFADVDKRAETFTMYQSGHAFVGPGVLENITLQGGDVADNVIKVFDTDVANTNDDTNIVAYLKNTAANEVVDPSGMPVEIRRGCYVQLEDPAGTVTIDSDTDSPRAVVTVNPRYYGSRSNLVRYGQKRVTV